MMNSLSAAALAAQAMGRATAAEQQPSDFISPEPCLSCGWLFERTPTAIEIKRSRTRKIDGYVCSPECADHAKHANGNR